MHNRAGFPRTLRVLAAVLAVAVMSGCESPIEKERRELRESLEEPETLIYRGLKVALRGMPSAALVDTAMTEERFDEIMKSTYPEFQATKVYFLTLRLLNDISYRRVPASVEDIVLYARAARELYELRSELRRIDEDRYPTVLEVILTANGSNPVKSGLPWYNGDYEHLFLCALWTGSRVAPRSFRTYELSEIEPGGLSDPSLQLLAYLVRGVAFSSEHWPYMAEEEFTRYLETLERRRDELAGMKTFGSAAHASGDTLYAWYHAPGVLLRGLTRRQIEKEDAAVEDFEAFLIDARLLGIDNEGVWLIGTYVSLKKDRPEEAAAYLEKLAGSPMFDEEEKELIREAIEYLKERDSEQALTRISDKVFIGRMMVSYLKIVLKETGWYDRLEKSESGQNLVQAAEGVQKTYRSLVQAADPTQWGGELRERATSWWKKLFQ
jgi:hypothetical protein